MYTHYVEYLWTSTYPNFTLPDFGDDENDKKKIKSKQSAFRRWLKVFHLTQDGVTLMYFKTHFRGLKKVQQQRAPMVKKEESSDESDSDSEKPYTAKPPILLPEAEALRKVVLKGHVKAIIQKVHDAIGNLVKNTYTQVKLRFYWNNVQWDCETFCPMCPCCQWNKPFKVEAPEMQSVAPPRLKWLSGVSVIVLNFNNRPGFSKKTRWDVVSPSSLV